MLLLDALYINDSGGKVLLDYLIQKLEATDKKVFYLLDRRVEGKVQAIKEQNKLVFLEASLIKRRTFYKKNKNAFSSVICFGNLPPNIRLEASVYTFLHQKHYVEFPAVMPLRQKFIFNLKRTVFRKLIRHSDYWLVQTSLMKKEFSDKYSVDSKKVIEAPFYPPLKGNFAQSKIKASFLYVSNAVPHKNFERLIEAFSIFYERYKTGTLTLTVSEHFPHLINLIKNKQQQGIPIKNIGFVPREQLKNLYSESEYFIFPSLAESFGLGLVEAIENGCKIIGTDLPYTYAVCYPSIVFNPVDIDSIVSALSLSLQMGIKPSVSKVHNQIKDLINLLH